MKIPYSYLLLGPGALFAFGFTLNALVMAANGAQMPVLIPGGIPTDGCPITQTDWTHTCMTASTHLKFLADWIVMKGEGVASIGDMFLSAGDAAFWPALTAWVALMIRKDK